MACEVVQRGYRRRRRPGEDDFAHVGHDRRRKVDELPALGGNGQVSRGDIAFPLYEHISEDRNLLAWLAGLIVLSAAAPVFAQNEASKKHDEPYQLSIGAFRLRLIA